MFNLVSLVMFLSLSLSLSLVTVSAVRSSPFSLSVSPGYSLSLSLYSASLQLGGQSLSHSLSPISNFQRIIYMYNKYIRLKEIRYFSVLGFLAD